MFRYNGYNITILKDKVIATQGKICFTFSTIEEAIAALSN